MNNANALLKLQPQTQARCPPHRCPSPQLPCPAQCLACGVARQWAGRRAERSVSAEAPGPASADPDKGAHGQPHVRLLSPAPVILSCQDRRTERLAVAFLPSASSLPRAPRSRVWGSLRPQVTGAPGPGRNLDQADQASFLLGPLQGQHSAGSVQGSGEAGSIWPGRLQGLRPGSGSLGSRHCPLPCLRSQGSTGLAQPDSEPTS